MTKKTRLIILLSCVACFVIIAPILVAYSEGYRFDFEKDKIVATGGIYVRTFPAADKIIIDSDISEKPGLFLNYIFVQSLLPKTHTVHIEKAGYFDYSKTLPVQENLATKLENVLLIKKNIAFTGLSDKVDYFSVAPNNQNIITAATSAAGITFNYFSVNATSPPETFSVAGTPSGSGAISDIKWSDDSSEVLIEMQNLSNIYYYFFDTSLLKPAAVRLSYLDKNSQQISFDPQDSKTIFFIKNKTLYSAKGDVALPVINNVISFKISGQNIIWLSSKGAMSDSDLSGKLMNTITSQNFSLDNAKTYQIVFISGNTFLQTDNAFFELNPTTKIFENFPVPLNNFKILSSSDGKNLIYWNSDKIYLYDFADKKFTELFSGSQISACQWINNDYIIFTNSDNVIISEIDYRGNINAITLPAELNIGKNKTLEIKSPQTFFNQQDGKLYILTQNTLLSSEKITP